MVKIIATNHDMSDPNVTVVIIRSLDRAERTIQLLKECGYQTITVEDITE